MQYTFKYEDECKIVVPRTTDLRDIIASGYEITNISGNNITLKKPSAIIIDDTIVLSSKPRTKQKKLYKALHKCLETGELEDILKKGDQE